MKPMDFTVIVIGAGMTGIGAGYYLGARRIPYAILEAKPDLGGVWNTHRWHGARCDSAFIKYSFSFKPFLSAACLHGRERIHRYLREVASEFRILEHIRFGTRVAKVVFDEAARRWTVHTERGTFTARYLINGNGYFSDQPHVPAFEGAARFRGEIVHTSHLDAGRSFAGKRVVLVGSGATAICCAPELARVSGSLVLLQRSPSYIYETDNRAGPLMRLCQGLYRKGLRLPVQWLRHYLQLRDDLIFVGFRRLPRLARWFFRRHRRDTVSEQAWREHFSPRYNPWEQRIPVAIGLKEALGFMLGGIPNYFHPMGSWHSAWTQRAEPLTRLAVRVVEHMERHGLGTVRVDREEVGAKPGITPNYVMRCLATMPRLQGTVDLPSIDNLLLAFAPPRLRYA